MALMVDTLELGPIEILKVQKTGNPSKNGATDVLEVAKAVVSDGIGPMTVNLNKLHTKSGVRLIDLVYASEAIPKIEAEEEGEIRYHERFGLVRIIDKRPTDWFNVMLIVEPVYPMLLETEDLFNRRDGEFCPPVDEVEDDFEVTRSNDARIPHHIYVHPSELTDPPKMRLSKDLYAVLRTSWEPTPTIEEFYHVLLTNPWGRSVVMGSYTGRIAEMPSSRLVSLKDGSNPESNPKTFIPWIRRGVKIWKNPVSPKEIGVSKIQGNISFHVDGKSQVTMWLQDGRTIRVDTVNTQLPTHEWVPMLVTESLDNPYARLACQWVDYQQQKRRLYRNMR
jgi:hypothetical protein